MPHPATVIAPAAVAPAVIALDGNPLGHLAARRAEEHAAALAAAAASLRRVRGQERRPEDLLAALEGTVELWISIQTTIKAPPSRLSPEVRTNLLRLGDFVIGTIFREGTGIGDRALDALININTQIAIGLREGLPPTG